MTRVRGSWIAAGALVALVAGRPGISSAQPTPAPDTSGATAVSPVTVRAARTAATIEVPSDDSAKGHWASAWPVAAYRNGVGGHADLSCDIDRHGLAERCRVISETPPGQGFGAAALALRPTFKLNPAMGPDGPIDAVMTIAVDFKPPRANADWAAGTGPAAASKGPLSNGGGADAPRVGGPEPVRHLISMLDNPEWANTVGYDEVIAAYPARAAGAEGYAVAHCEVHHDGALSLCQIIKEDPENRGFGEAALRLAARFRVAPEWSRAPQHADLWVDIPIRFPAPGASEKRIVRDPHWLAGFDPGQALKIFPREAADAGLTTGLGVVDCQVARDGALTACSPARADPEGLGFAEAAVVLASTMRINPWLRDGEPADGAVIRVPIRLNLKPRP